MTTILEKVEKVLQSDANYTTKLQTIADLTKDYVDPGFGMRIGTELVWELDGYEDQRCYVDAIHYRVSLRDVRDDSRFYSGKAPSTVAVRFKPVKK